MILKKYSYLFIILICLILFLPFIGHVHLFDWDEINFAEAAREILITHKFFQVQINFQPFWEKPPLFFWLQAGSMYLFGINEFAARLPNVICGILTLILIFKIGKKYFSIQFAWIWVLCMLASLTPGLYFKSGIIDPFFNLFIYISIYILGKITFNFNHENNTISFLKIGFFIGLAVLTKGPVAVLIIGICGLIFIFLKKGKLFFTLPQILLCILVIIALSAIWIINEIITNGISNFSAFITYQIELFTKPVALHGEPWYYHIVVLLIGCFPASIFFIGGLFIKNTDPNKKAINLIMKTIFWVVLILFSIVKTKIIHYSSLCWLPITFIAALYIDNCLIKEKKIARYLLFIFLLIGLILSIIFIIIPCIDKIKNQIFPYIDDPFFIKSMDIQGGWKSLEIIIAVFILMSIISFFIYFYIKKTNKLIYFFLCFFIIFTHSYLYIVFPKIEKYSQGPAIDFYTNLKDKDFYIETFLFKSYAQYFYTNAKPKSNFNYSNIDWLLNGKIDKPTFIVIKCIDLEKIDKNKFKIVQQKGGYILLERIF